MNESNGISVGQLNHLTLVVSDLDASRNFYVGLLGMEEVERPAFDFPGAWFQSGQTQIHVTLTDKNSGLAGWADRQVGRLSRGHHFAFQVENIHAAIAFLRGKGIEIKSGPKQRPDGPTQIYICDPDNHLIELFSN